MCGPGRARACRPPATQPVMGFSISDSLRVDSGSSGSGSISLGASSSMPHAMVVAVDVLLAAAEAGQVTVPRELTAAGALQLSPAALLAAAARGGSVPVVRWLLQDWLGMVPPPLPAPIAQTPEGATEEHGAGGGLNQGGEAWAELGRVQDMLSSPLRLMLSKEHLQSLLEPQLLTCAAESGSVDLVVSWLRDTCAGLRLLGLPCSGARGGVGLRGVPAAAGGGRVPCMWAG